MLKSCLECGNEKCLSEFGSDRSCSDGKNRRCKLCRLLQSQAFRTRMRGIVKVIPTMVKCLDCSKDLPSGKFHKDETRPNGLCRYCKTCARKRQDTTRHKNREAFVAPTEGTHFCRDCKQDLHVSCFTIDRAQKSGLCYYCKACQFEQHQALRAEVMAHYCDGPLRCACCGIDEMRFLCVDHIDGGGAEHRKSVVGGAMYRWLKKKGYPIGFQILCYNCNITKGQYGICPHQEKKLGA